MHQLLRGLVVVACLLVSASAPALPTQRGLPGHHRGPPGGRDRVRLSMQDVAGACRYAMKWASVLPAPGEQCYVDEVTSRVFRSCLEAATVPMATLV